MKVYDCFTYMNEDVVLDLRLNYLNKFVDKFVIVESLFFHNGKPKKLNFDIKKFSKFREKIIYLSLNNEPDDVESINKKDSIKTKNSKHILNGMRRDIYQRNYILNALKDSEDTDIIFISDIDEIPKLDNFDMRSINNEIIFFKQKMFYYKFNLCAQSIDWFGTRACKKMNFFSPQWLRNIKSKKYSKWRLDTMFSKNKYSNLKFIDDGGWHFSYLNSPQEIENKLKNYAHYREYQLNPLGIDSIRERIINKTSVYNLGEDMKKSKFTSGLKLKKINIDILPTYLQINKEKYIKWLE
jgi:beta-1,4-mannosyl-glycoprotein beta-1,4-N-acetylglucosaminyltransferase